MAVKTRLGQFGVGLAKYGTFSAKAPNTVHPHNPGVITRLSQFAIGVAKYGTFLPKTAAPVDAGATGTGWITRGQSFGRFSRHKGYSR